MKKALSAVALFSVTFLAYFLAALVKAMNRNVSASICAAVAAVMALISTTAYYVKNALSKKEGCKEV